MKLRHNDLIQLRKAGISTIDAKIIELKNLTLQKNPLGFRILRRSIAQLNTIASEIRGSL